MKYAIYIPSRKYDNREDVPRDEESESTNELSYIIYEDVSNKNGKTGNGIEYTKYERIIDTKAHVDFKVDDVIKIDDISFKIKDMEKKIPEDKKRAVSYWGSKLEKLKAVKRLYLK